MTKISDRRADAAESTALAPRRQLTALDQVPPGVTIVVTRLTGHGAIRRRLLDMGLRQGVEVKVERVAPLGDPIEILVLGYHLSLRREEAASLEVEVVEMPLTMVGPGQTVRCVGLRGGRGRRQRLTNLGISPDLEMTVVSGTEGSGPLVVQAGERQLIIGRGMAEGVWVRPSLDAEASDR